jgi:hypothetical protein
MRDSNRGPKTPVVDKIGQYWLAGRVFSCCDPKASYKQRALSEFRRLPVVESEKLISLGTKSNMLRYLATREEG